MQLHGLSAKTEKVPLESEGPNRLKKESVTTNTPLSSKRLQRSWSLSQGLVLAMFFMPTSGKKQMAITAKGKDPVVEFC